MCDNSPEAGEKKGENPDDKQKYIQLVYRSALEDIRFFKSQQWLVTYYTLLVYWVLVAAAKSINYGAWLSCLVPVVLVMSCALICQLEHSIKEQRKIKDEAIEKIKTVSEEIKDLFPNLPTTFSELPLFILLSMTILGGCVTVWIITNLPGFCQAAGCRR